MLDMIGGDGIETQHRHLIGELGATHTRYPQGQRQIGGIGLGATDGKDLLQGGRRDFEDRIGQGNLLCARSYPDVTVCPAPPIMTAMAPSRIAIILPAATYRAEDFLQAARTLGAEVMVATDAPQTLAASMDPPPLTVDLSDVRGAAAAIVAAGTAHPLDAVVAVDDPGTLIAALAAKHLGLTHNPPHAVAATRDKARMRRLLSEAAIPQPGFRSVTAPDDAVKAAAELGFPVVVKPTTLSASRGVIRADDDAGVRDAVARIRAILGEGGHPPQEPLLVEQFVAGPEFAVEGLLRRGHLVVLALFEKPDPLNGPYFEETMLIAPARVEPEAAHRLTNAAAAAATALGLMEGPVHIEMRLASSGPVVLEAAARTIGGLCGRALRFGLFGEPLELLVLRHALGMDLPATTTRAPAVGALMLPIPRSGTLHGVAGINEARDIEGILDVEITAHPGSRIDALPEGDRYLGFVFAAADSPDAVESSLRRAGEVITVEIR